MNIDNCLELTDDQFSVLPNKQKLDVIYTNVRSIAGIRRTQKMQWASIGICFSSIGWVFFELWKHIGGN